MRIARIELEGSPVTAVVDGDSVRPVPGVEVLDLLTAPPERARTACRGRRSRDPARRRPSPVADRARFGARLLGLRAARRGREHVRRRPRRQGRRSLVREPGVLLLQPACHDGPRRRHRAARPVTRPRPRAGGRRRSSVAAARNISVRGGERLHRGLHDLQRLVRARHRSARRHGCRSAFTRPRTSPTRSARGSSRPDELESLPRRRPAEPAHDRARQRRRARQRHARVAWPGASRSSCTSRRAVRGSRPAT